jgi:hypothetical protein
MTGKDIIELLAEQNPDAIVWDGFDDAVIGYTMNHGSGVLVYDYDKMAEILVFEQGMDEEEAHDYLSYNMSFVVSEHMPIIMQTFGRG